MVFLVNHSHLTVVSEISGCDGYTSCDLSRLERQITFFDGV